MSEYTATPWHMTETQFDGIFIEGQFSIVVSTMAARDDQTGEHSPVDVANAALIVRAVNAHDALVEACKEAATLLYREDTAHEQACFKIEAALKLAEAS